MRAIRFAVAAAVLVAAPVAAQRGQEQEQKNAFTWSGELAEGARLTVRNLNGAVRVEAASGRTVEITATKRWRRGDPARVTIEATRVNSGRDVLVCAKWNPETECTENRYSSRSNGGMRSNDVSVEIVVRLPAGANLVANTVNGALEIRGATGEVRANTVNGGIEAESSGGPVSAETVNGSVRVRMARLPERGASYKTVNGSITITIPSSANANVVARTVNGSITTDFPITIEGSMSPRRLSGKIGNGGPTLEFSTVNGSVRLQKGS
jgi:hypothetical protein